MKPHIVSAGQIEIPLNIDYLTLGEALKQQIYTAPGGRAELWSGSDSCQFLNATNPRFGKNSATLKLETDAELSIGIAMSGNCVSPLSWAGIIEADLQPYIGPDLVIKFRVTDLNLYKTNHEKSLFAGRGFDLIKSNLIPRLEAFSYDFKPPLQQFEVLVQAAAPTDVAARVRNALSTLRPTSAVVPQAESLRLMLGLTAPDMPMPTPSASAAPLTQAEIDEWQTTLDNWDAFLVFVIEQLGSLTIDEKVRAELLNLLLDSRQRLVQALGQPQGASGPDPVRIIFLDEWQRLRAIVRSTAQRGMLGNRALEFLSFISAGDALFALDQAAPALGLRISADDLRRLARVMAPQYTADPLAFSFDVDPQLQKMFGVSAPLESPGPFEAPAEEGLSAPPNAASSAAPALASPPTAIPVLPPSRVIPSPNASFRLPNRLLGPAEAEAAESPSVTALLRVGAALNRVVVDDSNASAYTRSVESLLTLTGQHAINNDRLEPDLRQTYLDLVKSTGWQESCWRQFVRRKDRIHFLESSTGDIGLMQVNKHVWRGFYSVPRLEWDVVYNTSAGAEILMRLMRGAAQHRIVSGANRFTAIARSAYAAYNGGPSAYGRWTDPSEPVQIHEIDLAFSVKYRAITSGQSFDILRCATQWNTAPGH